MNTSDGPPENDDLGVRIRPYALTGGRTRPGTDLAIEAMVSASSEGLAAQAQGRLTLERARIVALCVSPQSLAEISAHLKIHLGVARVLVGDLAQEGLIAVNRPSHVGDRPDLRLLERVLDGLQAL